MGARASPHSWIALRSEAEKGSVRVVYGMNFSQHRNMDDIAKIWPVKSMACNESIGFCDPVFAGLGTESDTGGKYQTCDTCVQP